jgi:hypothetical protein
MIDREITGLDIARQHRRSRRVFVSLYHFGYKAFIVPVRDPAKAPCECLPLA